MGTTVTMVLISLNRSIAKRVSNLSTKPKRRLMGTVPTPEWTGIDKIVRGVFPEDYQLCGAIIGGYSTMIAFFALKSKLNKKIEERNVHSVESTDNDHPSIDSPEFVTFIENEANLNKWIQSWGK